MLTSLPFIAQTDALAQSGLSFGWLFLKTILAMFVVIALAFIVLRYLLPRLRGGLPTRNSRIKIVERFGLEPRKGLYIVQVGKKSALIATSDHNVNKLLDLEESDLKEKE